MGLHRQWPGNDSDACLYQGLSPRTSARSQQGNLFPCLEVPRASAPYYDGGRNRLGEDGFGSIGQGADNFEMQDEMLLELFPSAVIRRRTWLGLHVSHLGSASAPRALFFFFFFFLVYSHSKLEPSPSNRVYCVFSFCFCAIILERNQGK